MLAKRWRHRPQIAAKRSYATSPRPPRRSSRHDPRVTTSRSIKDPSEPVPRHRGVLTGTGDRHRDPRRSHRDQKLMPKVIPTQRVDPVDDQSPHPTGNRGRS